ncbi:MAG: 1,4-dihydroxy-6-naphthoate synthase [Desulfosarcina sp.]|nr:1,4-dihydroxy-6-naphthoate synthase [Desulfosarcina sp.]MBC2767842.1 1,4-dihydroxy-6-naphthoate synthase [Desulfosarcina sp.]
MFNAIAGGDVGVTGYQMKPVLHDVETLNGLALNGTFDVTKLSFYAWLKAKDRYRLLGSGAAMGFGCGPMLIARKPLKQAEIDRCRVVLPGRWTTAHLLFRLWAPDARHRLFAPYDKIFEALASGRADCGVIIHESRFTFEAAGFTLMVDLGAWWEEKTGLPIPLGGIAARKSLGEPLIEQIEATVNKSIRRAMANPDEALPYIRQHAQELDDTVLRAHIRTFVNDFSLELTARGRRAIDTLETMARAAGAI